MQMTFQISAINAKLYQTSDMGTENNSEHYLHWQKIASILRRCFTVLIQNATLSMKIFHGFLRNYCPNSTDQLSAFLFSAARSFYDSEVTEAIVVQCFFSAGRKQRSFEGCDAVLTSLYIERIEGLLDWTLPYGCVGRKIIQVTSATNI